MSVNQAIAFAGLAIACIINAVQLYRMSEKICKMKKWMEDCLDRVSIGQAFDHRVVMGIRRRVEMLEKNSASTEVEKNG